MYPGTLLARSLGADVPRPVDKSPTMAPHGFYRCAGDDAWVAIAVEDDGGWARLRGVLLDGDIEAPACSTLAERKARESDVDAAVTTWTAARSPWEITVACQDADVAAYPLMNSARLAWDQHLHERDFFAFVTHPVQGPGPVPGVTFRVGEGGARVRGPAPIMGEHNEAVFCGLLGLDRVEYDALVASGAIH